MSLNGVVFYEGPSQIDGQPIVAVATFKTSNDKTGNLIQTWIIRSDVHPSEALDTGADSSICGSCPLRGRIVPASESKKKTKSETVNKDRACYVLVQQAPAAIFKTYKAGKYPKLDKSHARYFGSKGLRKGSYGDPTAVPMEAWAEIESYVHGVHKPGYTHQWKDEKFSGWSTKVMASTHTLAENEVAQAAGWRTFRTIASVDDIAPNEILCPGSLEGGFTASCDQCGACDGRRGMEDKRRNVAIVAHGSGGKAERVISLVQLGQAS
jgi:hypothetical protein